MIDACARGPHPGCVADGKDYLIRPFMAADAAALNLYFGQLSARDRYNRFLGAIATPSASELTGLGLQGRLRGLVAIRGEGQVIGEARYAFDDENNAVEFALSVAGEARGAGIGSAFISQIEQRAARAGVATIMGDTLRTNIQMLALAKHRGFRLDHPPGDWTLVRFDKPIRDPLWMRQAAAPMDRVPAG